MYRGVHFGGMELDQHKLQEGRTRRSGMSSQLPPLSEMVHESVLDAFSRAIHH